MADELFKPIASTGPRPDPGTTDLLYTRSFLALRTFIGVLGVALPVLVVFGDRLLFHGRPYGQHWPRGSVSVYYYSGLREVFVGTIAATGVFFIAYRVWERNRENLLSWAAGLAACAIALFPTKPPGPVGDDPALVLSPLQNKFGVTPITTIHYVASAAFLVALAWISWQFGRREGDRKERLGMKRSPEFWRLFHRGCAAAMGLALLWVVVGSFAHVARATLIGEWVCAIAFGASWFWKGFELDALRGHPAQEVAPVGNGGGTGAT
jgi:hypothetical protein